MIKLLIPGQPCAKQRPRVVDGHTYTPAKTVNYETFIKELYVIGNYAKQLEGALQMTVRAYFQIPKSKPKKVQELMRQGVIRPISKPDWDNVGKIISDALNGLAYRDDSQIVQATVEKYYSIEPRVEVEIQEQG
ncbi:MAG: RusA family crossover junction endodeoxyribonuclease [Candidatus Babeliales bacterium]|jgi:Holliday junction resolvase RusA-like endonuclease